jgi:hypothetical protein
MNLPSGSLLPYLEYVVKHQEKEYPMTVTEENIEKLSREWNLKIYKKYPEHGDLRVGDVIDEWSHGGPLSMRAGENVIRDGVEIYTRLTKMS